MASVSGILMVKLKPYAGDGFHVDGAADLVDIIAHHVHADAAAGYAGDRRGGRKAGHEDEFVNLGFRQLLDLGFGGEALRDRLGLDALGVEAAAVVGDLDDDMAAFVIGRQANAPLLGLARFAALRRRFQAVIGRIAHHMRERILDQVEHLAIELGVGAVHFQVDLLAEFVGKIAHDARQLLPGIADRLHARLHDAFLQLGGDIGQPLQRRLEFGILVAAHDLKQLIAREHQLGHHGHQLFERIDGDADRLVGGLGAVLVFAAGFKLGRLGGLHSARLDRGFAECALKIVERILVRPQRAFEHLRRQRSHRVLRRRGAARSNALDHALEIGNQIVVGAVRFALFALERIENGLDAVDGGENERDRVVGRGQPIAKLAHQSFGRVRERFQPRQIEEAAGAFDGVNEAEDVIEDLGVVGILLETHELDVHDVETFVGLGHEFPQQVVH